MVNLYVSFFISVDVLDECIVPSSHPRKIAKFPGQVQDPISAHWIQKPRKTFGIFSLELPCMF